MNHQHRLITSLTLPLLLAVGCANTDSKPFSQTSATDETKTIIVDEDQADINESVKLAINNMDGYLKKLEQAQEHQLAAEPDHTAPLTENIPTEETTDMTVLIVEEGMDFEEHSENQTTMEFETLDQLADEESTTVLAPEQTKFFFGFNKTQLSEADKAVLTKHAAYLLRNPGIVLVISGHADNRGNKNYNQYLSLLRAESVAAILTKAGVPGSQLRVGGMGDNVPMVAENHWNENRRVELLYRDALMLSSQ